jgi:hypothetical protein
VANRVAADQFAANVLPIVRTNSACGITSLAGIAEALNASGVSNRARRRLAYPDGAQPALSGAGLIF